MRTKTTEMLNKVKSTLIDNHYQTSIQLAEKTGMSRSRIWQLIRYMRLQGIGIIPTNKGYVLSEYAKKSDDVHLMRRLYGRRTSDFITIQACEKDIRGRWKSIQERKLLQDMITPFNADLSSSKGMRALTTCQDRYIVSH